MASHVTHKNLLFGLLVLAGLIGCGYQAYRCWQIDGVNQAIRSDQPFESERYGYQQKFAAAYRQGQQQRFGHALELYNELLESDLPRHEQARVQHNIGNILFSFGLQRKIDDDGTLSDEARHAFLQARLAYEQALRLNPALRPTRLNLSLLDSVLPSELQGSPKMQPKLELSNLPIGLP